MTVVSTSGTPARVGALAGENAGSVTGARATGAVTAETRGAASTYTQTGGLIGFNDTGGAILASYAAVNVIGNAADEAQAGGLVGRNRGSISASFATGDVSVDGITGNPLDDGYAGGLVGVNSGAITAAYAWGDLDANATNVITGGLVGENKDSGGVITATYAIGAHTTATDATPEKGGLVGKNTGSATVSDSYWDSTISGITGTGQGTSKTTSQLQTPTAYGTGSSIYVNWNVDVDGDNTNDDPWDFGTASEYPVLKYTDVPANAATQRTVLGQVTGVAASWSSTNNVTVSWTAVTGADRYKVQWRQSGVDAAYSVTRQKVASPGSKITIDISVADGMAIGQTYHVQVIAAKAAVLDGDPSSEVKINVGQDYDADDDGMIEVKSLEQLNAIRWDLDADGVASSGNEMSYTGDTGAFPKAAEGMGCNEDETASADQVCTGLRAWGESGLQHQQQQYQQRQSHRRGHRRHLLQQRQRLGPHRRRERQPVHGQLRRQHVHHKQPLHRPHHGRLRGPVRLPERRQRHDGEERLPGECGRDAERHVGQQRPRGRSGGARRQRRCGDRGQLHHGPGAGRRIGYGAGNPHQLPPGIPTWAGWWAD